MKTLTPYVAWLALLIGLVNHLFGLVDANDINQVQEDVARFELRLDTIADR